MTRLRRLLVFPVLLVLGACASKFEADVSRFHRLEQPEGETIKIVPLDDAKAGSLEFQAYADMIAQELRGLGYDVVAPSAEADLVARVDYGVEDGNTVVRSYGGYGGYYGGYGRFGHYGGYPWWGPYGYGAYPGGFGGNNVRSYVVYPRWLVMQIVRADLTDQDPAWMVFEGQVESDGQNKRLNEIMPLLIDAMFAEFPGESGETTHVTIKLDGDDY